MDARVKKMWVEALRSGEFKQGTRRLFSETENTYCCLGVLCELHRREIGTCTLHGFQTEYGSDTLSRAVGEWAGLSSRNPTVQAAFGGLKGKDIDLIFLNDMLSVTFPMIADLIEANL